MPEAFNPYAPPGSVVPRWPGASGGTPGWRLEADRLIARKGAVLPPICLWTGVPTTGLRVRRTLAWAPTWLAILALSPIVYLIAYLMVRKTGELDYALGEVARKRQRAAVVIGTGGAAGAAALLFAGARFDLPGLFVASTLVFLVAVIAAAVLGRTVRPVKIDKEFIHLKRRRPVAEAFAHYSGVD